MVSIRAETILAAVNGVWQLVLATSDNTGGASGQDSILANLIASVDQSNGVLYLWALLNFLTESPLIWSSRWGMVHPRRRDRLHKTRLEIALRAHWRNFMSKSRRFAELDWVYLNPEFSKFKEADVPRLVVSYSLQSIT
jgi:hypothetical protein